MATLLSASAATAVSSNPAANAGLGGAVAAHIAHMRDALQIRGGQILGLKVNNTLLDRVKPRVFEIHTYRTLYTYNSRVVIDNIFQEHTARRYLQGSLHKIKPVRCTDLFRSNCFNSNKY